MSGDDRIDFGALDPARDPARWQARVAGVVTRAQARRRARSLPAQLVAWGRPALLAAAVLAVAVWAAALATRAPAAADPTDQLSAWAQNDELPATGRVLEIFGVSHGTQ